MTRSYRQISYVLFWALTGSCAGTGTLRIKGSPEKTEVFLIADDRTPTKIGQIPFTRSLDGLFAIGNSVSELRLQKKGYHTQSIIIPRHAMKATHEITINLESLPEQKVSENRIVEQNTQKLQIAFDEFADNILKKAQDVAGKQTEQTLSTRECKDLTKNALNALGKGIASVQARILRQDFDVAHSKLASMLADFPNVSVLYDLQGNIFYLQKRFTEALRSYEKSLELEPNNVETSAMVKRLKEITGGGRDR